MTVPPRDPADPTPNPPPGGGRPGPFPPQPARPQFPPPPAGPPFTAATGSFPRLPAAPASGTPMSGAPMSGPGAGAPPPPPQAPRTVRGTGGLMMILVVVALIASLTAVALSVYAIGAAGDSKSDAAPAAAARAGADPVTPTKVTTTTARQPTKAPSPKASAGELDPKAEFTEAYTPSTKKLSLHPAVASYSYRSIDLDKPEVGVEDDRADLTLSNSQGEFFQFPNGAKAAIAPNPDVQANDCAELIPSSALPSDAKISVNTPDLTVCVVTSFESAQRQGLSWKLVLIHVTSVSTDGTVNVDLKAWNIPL